MATLFTETFNTYCLVVYEDENGILPSVHILHGNLGLDVRHDDVVLAISAFPHQGNILE